ncbi:MAG TPA: radical SAM protein [Candidatus Saccharimonadales bacterium]|nr:radical SAM protein [Candidatus Saccharimonadales bacterium]
MKGAVIVNEIFTSIQGETVSAGRPCTFVRLTGCNLRCSYCDTAYAFHEGHEKPIAGILDEVSERGVRFVTVTGGEPLLQEGAFDLVAALLDRGCEVQVETSGAVDTAGLDPRARVILDVKTPGSGESGRMIEGLVPGLRPGDEAKFVIVDRADYEFARSYVRAGRIPRGVTVLFSPAHAELEPKTLAGWILADALDVRLQLQIHKYIWGAERRGV